MKKIPKSISLYSIREQEPPSEIFIWVTNGLGKWAQARLNLDGSWNIIPEVGYEVFSFHYWAPIVDDKIISFKEWFKELND